MLPNIVYVFADEFRQQSLGFLGEDPTVTPNLDNFYKESLFVKNAISNNPVCSPYRAMLLTGKTSFKTGVTTNCNSKTEKDGVFLKQSEVCMSDILSQNGYSLGYIGKWHLDAPKPEYEKYVEPVRYDGLIWDSFTPKSLRHGFDYWYSYGCCDNHFHPHYWLEDNVEKRIDIDEWSAKHETDIAIEYIKNTKGQRDAKNPFALFVSYNPPHMPFDTVPDKYLDCYPQNSDELLNRENIFDKCLANNCVKEYFAAVTGIDEQFGRILNSLKEQGLENNTIVIFTSDHGEMMGSFGLVACKNIFYNESVKVPFLIRYPNYIKAGETDLLLSVYDIFPTLMGIIEKSDLTPDDIDGEDLSQTILGKSKYSPELAFYFNDNFLARGLITKTHTFAVMEKDDTVKHYLFDNTKDKYQLNNIFDTETELSNEFISTLKELIKNNGDIKGKILLNKK